jgi:superkiller protein 3
MLTAARTAATILLVLLCLAASLLALAEETGEAVDERIAEIEVLASQAAENPGDVELLIELGNLYYEVGMQNEALATYLEVTQLDSTHVGALSNLGSLYTDMGQFDNAHEQLLRATVLDPDNAMVYTNLGSNYYARRKYVDAVEMYRKALTLDENSVEAHFNLGVAFADAQLFDEAIREWQQVIAIAPKGDIAQICRDNIDMINEFRRGN